MYCLDFFFLIKEWVEVNSENYINISEFNNSQFYFTKLNNNWFMRLRVIVTPVASMT